MLDLPTYLPTAPTSTVFETNTKSKLNPNPKLTRKAVTVTAPVPVPVPRRHFLRWAQVVGRGKKQRMLASTAHRLYYELHLLRVGLKRFVQGIVRHLDQCVIRQLKQNIASPNLT